jgi:hypothetical protein
MKMLRMPECEKLVLGRTALECATGTWTGLLHEFGI